MLFHPRRVGAAAAHAAPFLLLSLAGGAYATVGNSAPVAEAGLGVYAYVGDTVILNGEASADPDGQALTYAWSQIAGPPTALTDATTARPSFTVAEPGTVWFQLVVSDGTLASVADTVAVVVPDRAAEPLGSAGGCATGPAPAWLGLLALGLVGARRR